MINLIIMTLNFWMIEYIIYRKKGLLYIKYKVTIQNIIVYIDIQKNV